MTIWDRGTYECLMGEKAGPQAVAEAIDAGRIEFVMQAIGSRGGSRSSA